MCVCTVNCDKLTITSLHGYKQGCSLDDGLNVFSQPQPRWFWVRGRGRQLWSKWLKKSFIVVCCILWQLTTKFCCPSRSTVKAFIVLTVVIKLADVRCCHQRHYHHRRHPVQPACSRCWAWLIVQWLIARCYLSDTHIHFSDTLASSL